MAINNGKNDVNEELPDEYEVIQHSLRDKQDKPDKQQQDSTQKQPPGKKQENPDRDKEQAPSGETVKNK